MITGLRADLTNNLQQLKATEKRHAQIRNNHIDRVPLQNLDGLFRRGGGSGTQSGIDHNVPA